MKLISYFTLTITCCVLLTNSNQKANALHINDPALLTRIKKSVDIVDECSKNQDIQIAAQAIDHHNSIDSKIAHRARFTPGDVPIGESERELCL